MLDTLEAPTTTEPPAEPDTSHEWIGACTIALTDDRARYVAYRQSFRTDSKGLRVDVLEVYCKHCRRQHEDVADQQCSAKIDNRHLIGGDQSTRAKRLPRPVAPPGAVLIPGPRINRRGIEAYVSSHV